MSKSPGYTLVTDLMDAKAALKTGILSRTVHADDAVKVVLFHFAKGEELSEHTASMPALLHFLAGDADLKLGETEMKGGAGDWVHMEAGLPHSIRARTAVTMLLTLLKKAGG